MSEEVEDAIDETEPAIERFRGFGGFMGDYETPKLDMKISRVMEKMKRLKKTGLNSFHKYKFATDADVSDAVRGALAKEGVAFYPEMISIERTEAGKTRNGLIKWHGLAKFRMTFSAAGESRSLTWFSEALDQEDKLLNKCATAAVKYFLLKTFLISTGDEAADPDRSSPNAEGGSATAVTKEDLQVLVAAATKKKDVNKLRSLWETAKNDLKDDALADTIKAAVKSLDS